MTLIQYCNTDNFLLLHLLVLVRLQYNGATMLLTYVSTTVSCEIEVLCACTR